MSGLTSGLVPADVRRLGKELLNQQMWCWGCDIRRGEGNLLKQYGFVKHAAPEQSGLKPCYSLTSPDGVTIGLWGFGMFFAHGDGDGLFLKRFDFSPRLMAAHEMSFDVWAPVDLPESRAPGDWDEWHRSEYLLNASLRWIASYERWVQAEAGTSYRARTVELWRGLHKRIAVDARSMAETWEHLSECCGAHCHGAGIARTATGYRR